MEDAATDDVAIPVNESMSICSGCCQAALPDENLSHHRYRGAEGEIVCENTNNQARMFSLVLCIATEV